MKQKQREFSFSQSAQSCECIHLFPRLTTPFTNYAIMACNSGLEIFHSKELKPILSNNNWGDEVVMQSWEATQTAVNITEQLSYISLLPDSIVFKNERDFA